MEPPASVAFGRFRVLPHRRELLADGQQLKLGGRAHDVLMALIEGRGSVVTKDALLARVWPGRIVEESALQVQISVLRAAFGPERELIRTVSGRGYQFTGEIVVVSANLDDEPSEAAPRSEAPLPPTNVPEPVCDLIGRDKELQEVLSLAAEHRLLTLTGPGGIGKTRLALAVARRLLPQFADGVWVAELSPLTDPGLVAATVASAVGIELPAGEISAQRVAQLLTDRRLLLVLDTCEHVIAASAELAEALLRAGSTVRIVATSREPLRAEGEQTCPVEPLAVPTETAEDPGRYGAVQLFMARSRATGARISEARNVARRIAAICQQLDGIPLAIELAASRAAMLGVEQLAARLDDRFSLLTSGRRMASPRHQTLRAALDWSYKLLTVPERLILPRLAVFAGTFSLDAADAIVGGGGIALPDVVEYIFNLVAKSLVATVIEGETVRYRLLDTTQAYVLQKLTESGEREQFARRHAEYYLDLFQRAEREAAARPRAEWLADYAPEIDNLRAALGWAFSPGGDPSIGVALTTAAVPLWMCLSLLEECRGRAQQGLNALETEGTVDPREEMRLQAALGAAIHDPFEMGAAFTKALDIAESLGDTEYQLRALSGLCSSYAETGRASLPFAQKFHDLATTGSNLNNRLFGERMLGSAKHFHGDQAGARRHLEKVLSHIPPPARVPDFIRFHNNLRTLPVGTDPRISARAYLARVLWLQGFVDQAVRSAEISIEEAEATGHALSLCYALTLAACPIALWVGNFTAAARYTRMLLDHSRRHSLLVWGGFGSRFQRILAVRGRNLPPGWRPPHTGVDEIADPGFSFRFYGLIELADALACAGEIAEALALVETGFEQSEGGWFTPELLRLKGDLLLSQNASGGTETAEDLFRQALDEARRQAAMSWELRAATSLARLLRARGSPTDAIACLQPVYHRFTEGLDTADLIAAKRFLDEPGDADPH